MRKKIIVVAAILVLASIYIFYNFGGMNTASPDTLAEPSPLPTDSTETYPSPDVAQELPSESAPESTSEAVSEPAPEPTPEPTPEPKSSWTLAFAGDCTIGTLHEWQGSGGEHNMLSVIGSNYSYPFYNVRDAFAMADFSMVNFEGTLTTEVSAKRKQYRFRAHPEYAETLVLANIDAVSLANNHSGDYLQKGLEDTRSALDEKGILWADDSRPLIVELEGGLKLGIVAHNNVEIVLRVGDVDGYMKLIQPLYEQCLEAQCDIIMGFVHWGWEYTAGPETWMVDLAHRMVDLGFDMVVGSHAHVLQETEAYEGAPIFYSLGNFCFGGHSNPRDKDSVIVLQTLELDEDGNAVIGETKFLPCSISGREDRNDFQPRFYEEDEAGYERVLEKLKANG